MADYRDLAAALGGGYGQDTGPITADTLITLKNGKTATASDLLGMLKGYGQSVGSNLESLGRGGLSQFLGSPVDTANTIRTPYPMEVFGDVNYTPDKQLPGGSRDILGMMPRATAARPETAGMEELGGFMAPATAKVLKPAVVATGRMIGKEVNAGLTGQPTRSLLGDITPKPLMAVEPQMQMAQALTKADKAEARLLKSKEFGALKGQDRDRAIESVRAKAENTGIPRSMEELKLAVGNEEDIARSLMNNPGFKVGQVVPEEAVNRAMMARGQMRMEAPQTPGPNAPEAEWAKWGESHGVNMTVTPPQDIGITDLTSKRGVKIPGGFEGTFTIPDLFWMKANNFDPAALPKDLHDQLMQKFIRTHEIQNPDQVDIFNRLNFALLSPNAPLTPNEFLAQRFRLKNVDELQALAGRYGEPNLAQTASTQTGVGSATSGGMGILGTADLSNQAMLAKLVLEKPEMFKIAPGETMRDVTTRVMNQVRGLGPKTASLGTPWLDLNKANTSAVDLHMIRNSYDRMLDDPVVGDAFVKRMSGLLKTEPTAEAIRALPAKKVEDAAIQVIGGTDVSRVYRSKTGELNKIPASATPEKLAFEPEKFQEFNPFYNRVVDYVDESRGANPILELFPEQWRKWDVYRQRVEPHEFAHPDYRKLPRQSWTEMQDALTAHKQAGYTQSLNPVMNESDWRKLYYGRADVGLLGMLGAGAGGASLYNRNK
jgi:hypothetical protein